VAAASSVRLAVWSFGLIGGLEPAEASPADTGEPPSCT
jgi:hypothetical protein